MLLRNLGDVFDCCLHADELLVDSLLFALLEPKLGAENFDLTCVAGPGLGRLRAEFWLETRGLSCDARCVLDHTWKYRRLVEDINLMPALDGEGGIRIESLLNLDLFYTLL